MSAHGRWRKTSCRRRPFPPATDEATDPRLPRAGSCRSGLTKAQLPLIYLAGRLCTYGTTPIIGRLADRHDKLHVLGWLSLAAAVVVLILTNLPPAPVWVALLMTALFMITMSGRFAPAMAMMTIAVDARYRSGFMSVNSVVQQAATGLANLTAGLLVVAAADGRLTGFPRVGYVAICCFGLAIYLGGRLRAAAPHSARTPHAAPAPAAAAAVE